MIRKAITIAATAATAVCAASVLYASPASADTSWVGLQHSVDFTVYVPGETYGMERTKLERTRDCAEPMAAPHTTVSAVFKKTSTKKIKVYEAGHDDCWLPAAPILSAASVYKTFDVQDGDGTAEVRIDCMDGFEDCPEPSKSGIKEIGAWVYVPLKAANGHDATYAYVYSIGFSYSKLKDFVWSMSEVA